MTDCVIDRLCLELYGRKAQPSDYRGGSCVRMLSDALGKLVQREYQSALLWGHMKDVTRERFLRECPEAAEWVDKLPEL